MRQALRIWLVLACASAALVMSPAPALAAPTLVSLTLDPHSIGVGATSSGTVTLSEPAQGDTAVSLSSSSPSASVPGQVVVLSGSATGAFQVTGTSQGDALITATLGAATASDQLHVGSAEATPVINEVDYDQPGTDTGEFVEIYNPSSSTADLSHDALVLVNGADGHEYERTLLSGSLAPNGYLVVADPDVPVPGSAQVLRFSGTQAIQNGAPDGVALIDTASTTLVDALSYAGSITNAQITGFSASVSLVEGTATTALDDGTGSASLGRSPNGVDSNDASADWMTLTPPTPGTENGFPPPPSDAPPVLGAIGSRSVTAGQTLTIVVSATDSDSDALDYSVSNLPPGATFQPATRTFTWTPTAAQAGTYPNVHFQVSDGTESDSEDITVTVVSAPPAPALAPDTQLTQHPGKRVRTQHKHVRVKVAFTATQAGATFECKLDGRPYTSCTSPFSVRVGPGRHTVLVAAVGPGGTDATPASASFRVVRVV